MIWEKHKYLVPLADPTAHGRAFPDEGFRFNAPASHLENDDLPTLAGSQKQNNNHLGEPNHWRDVDHAVKMVLALESKDASSFLKSLAIRRPSLYQEVVWFLGAQDGLDGFMEAPLGENLSSFFQDLEPVNHLKTSNGEYPVLEILGEGGMGRVYLVEQQQAYGRKVALKMLRTKLKEKSHLARFENEFRLLTDLNHPNIAHVYEGGKTQEGQPFYTMEYVAGLTIDRHCRKYRLSMQERLEIFLQVCSAVSYAHKKGVIHRDIKPGNILVSVMGGSPLPKLIDFGIAKSMGAGLSQTGFHTRTDQVIGTPIYMSPEQIDHAIWDVDWRSDVYALGVLLYELLTGFPIVDPKAIAEMPLQQALEKIVVDAPIKPSERLGKTPIAHIRGEFGKMHRAGSLVRTLRGELDWIVCKAMAKDRRNRYENVKALMDDIRAYQNGLPIQAHPGSNIYRIKKYLVRHRLQLCVALFTALAFMVSIMACLWVQIRWAGKKDECWATVQSVKMQMPENGKSTSLTQKEPKVIPGYQGLGTWSYWMEDTFWRGKIGRLTCFGVEIRARILQLLNDLFPSCAKVLDWHGMWFRIGTEGGVV